MTATPSSAPVRCSPRSMPVPTTPKATTSPGSWRSGVAVSWPCWRTCSTRSERAAEPIPACANAPPETGGAFSALVYARSGYRLCAVGRGDPVNALHKDEIQFSHHIPSGVRRHGEGKPVPPDIDVGPVLELYRRRADLGHDLDSVVIADGERLADTGRAARPAIGTPEPVADLVIGERVTQS